MNPEQIDALMPPPAGDLNPYGRTFHEFGWARAQVHATVRAALAAQAKDVPLLSDDEIAMGWRRGIAALMSGTAFMAGARWAERAVREKCGVKP